MILASEPRMESLDFRVPEHVRVLLWCSKSRMLSETGGRRRDACQQCVLLPHLYGVWAKLRTPHFSRLSCVLRMDFASVSLVSIYWISSCAYQFCEYSRWKFLVNIFFTCFLFCIMSFLSTRVSADMFGNESLSKHDILFFLLYMCLLTPSKLFN